VLESFQFLDSGGGRAEGEAPRAARPAAAAAPAPEAPDAEAPSDDDVPF